MNAQETIQRLIVGEDLKAVEAEQLMIRLTSGSITPAQVAATLVALRIKGETVDEITAFAKVMRSKAVHIYPQIESILVDTCGTGGDKVKTFNTSTTAALIAAGAGVYVAKHGNRSVSSKCGSADLLEGLGVKISSEPAIVQKCIERAGIGFLFAPIFHPSMKNLADVRRELGVRTVFNLLGPLTNPANANAQLVGVFDPSLTELLAKVLQNLGIQKAAVAHGQIGVDEVSIIGKTKISELNNGSINTSILSPRDAGLKPAKRIADISGGTREENMAATMAILNGENGPKRDMAVLNAAVVLKLANLADSLHDGVEIANAAIEDGKAKTALLNLIRESGGNIEVMERFD